MERLPTLAELSTLAEAQFWAQVPSDEETWNAVAEDDRVFNTQLYRGAMARWREDGCIGPQPDPLAFNLSQADLQRPAPVRRQVAYAEPQELDFSEMNIGPTVPMPF